jgi:hypothetical protein
MYTVAESDLYAGFLNDHIHFLIHDHSAVFSRTDEVIEQERNIVAFVDIYAHGYIVHRSRAAGYLPREDNKR